MDSFQLSRGRVFLEALLALGMSASLAGAWMQTHATALLGAAGVAAFYGLIHLFDMRRPKSAGTAEPQRIDFDREVEQPVADVVVPMVSAEELAAVDTVAEEAVSVEPVSARAGSGRRSGGCRKSTGRRTKAKAGTAAEPAAVEPLPVEGVPVEEAQAPWPMAEEADAVEPAWDEEEFTFHGEEESSQPQIQPLFEPEPFVRMPRQGFGRRGRL